MMKNEKRKTNENHEHTNIHTARTFNQQRSTSNRYACPSPNLLWSPKHQPQFWEPKLHRFSPVQGAVSLISNDLRKIGNR
jgi:hypothetical protein